MDRVTDFFKSFFRVGEKDHPEHQRRRMMLLNNARACNFAGVSMALNTGADVNSQDSETGMTPLHYAAEKNSIPLINLLQQKGARGDIPDFLTGSTPLMIATENNFQKSIKALMALEANGLNLKDNDGRSVVNMALSIGKDKVAHYFVDMGADAQASVAWALENESDPQLMWLIKHGATPDVLDNNGYSPLMRAVLERNLKDVKKWLSRNADPNWTEGGGDLVATRGKTPLMVAIDQRDIEIANALILQPGSNLDAQDTIGETAIMKAVRALMLETCQLLIESGADHKIISNEGVNLLIAGVQSGEVEMVQAVWELGDVNPNQANSNGWTALMFAANGGMAKTVEFLLSVGVDPNYRSPTLGITALDLAKKSMAPKVRENPTMRDDFEHIIRRLEETTQAA